MQVLPGIILAVIGLYLLAKVQAAGVASRLNLYISSFSLSWSGLTPVVNLSVTAQNVTNDALQFTALAANAFLNGSLIGNVSGFTPVTIMPAAQTIIPLQVIVNGAGLVSQVSAILTGNAGSASLEIKGTANVSSLVVPIDVTYEAL